MRIWDNIFVQGSSAQIKTIAAELGFAKCGIVPAHRLNTGAERLREWLNRGYHGEMGWMDRPEHDRADPRTVMPQARSVIVLATNYFTPHVHPDDAPAGKISRYAWGDDYHDVLREKMRLLLGRMKGEWPEINGRICVDTAPIMEKEWAVGAGLGWIGKHSNLITKDVGSWVFLSELLLDVELEYDEKIVEDHCGTCTACLDSCPTSAIVEPYVVDARKCISYATIELRDERLPDKISENLNGWLYGCDICQEVCPWNRFEKPTEEARFEPRQGETSLPLDRIDTMEHAEYVERFRGSAMKRTKLGGLKRNARHLRGG
ncbi:MAG: tRNA epoxyqueuosine(34) reductase QueG [bacterium]|nr:tRNA epoxyqueuosine(34) reductase QueG [bacterium]